MLQPQGSRWSAWSATRFGMTQARKARCGPRAPPPSGPIQTGVGKVGVFPIARTFGNTFGQKARNFRPRRNFLAASEASYAVVAKIQVIFRLQPFVSTQMGQKK